MKLVIGGTFQENCHTPKSVTGFRNGRMEVPVIMQNCSRAGEFIIFMNISAGC